MSRNLAASRFSPTLRSRRENEPPKF